MNASFLNLILNYVYSSRGHYLCMLFFMAAPPPCGAVDVLVWKPDATSSFRRLFCCRPTGICHHCFSRHHSPPAPHIPLHSLKDFSPSSSPSLSSFPSFSDYYSSNSLLFCLLPLLQHVLSNHGCNPFIPNLFLWHRHLIIACSVCLDFYYYFIFFHFKRVQILLKQ